MGFMLIWEHNLANNAILLVQLALLQAHPLAIVVLQEKYFKTMFVRINALLYIIKMETIVINAVFIV